MNSFNFLNMKTSERIKQRMKELGLKQVDIMRMTGATKGSVSQWVSGASEPSGKYLSPLADALGCSVDWVIYGKDRRQQPTGLTEFEVLEPWDSNTPLDDDEVEVPFFTDVEMAAGHGRIPVRENGGPKLRFSKSTLRRHHVEPALIACAKVSGNSMEPAIPDGATIGIDTGKTDIKDGDIFAISHQDELRVKVLYKQPGHLVRLRSFNSDEWPEEIYPASDIKVLGRVFWWSVLR